jgi:hypothetical protein
MDRVRTADHDHFAYVPGGKREDKTGKKPMSDILWVTGEDDQTEGEVHHKGKRRW